MFVVAVSFRNEEKQNPFYSCVCVVRSHPQMVCFCCHWLNQNEMASFVLSIIHRKKEEIIKWIIFWLNSKTVCGTLCAREKVFFHIFFIIWLKIFCPICFAMKRFEFRIISAINAASNQVQRRNRIWYAFIDGNHCVSYNKTSQSESDNRQCVQSPLCFSSEIHCCL